MGRLYFLSCILGLSAMYICLKLNITDIWGTGCCGSSWEEYLSYTAGECEYICLKKVLSKLSAEGQ